MSLNCHYLVLFKSSRDSSQVNHLAKQMFPGHTKYMQEAFQDATKRPYGYLLCDLKPEYLAISWEDTMRLCKKGVKSVNQIKFLQLRMAQRLRKSHDFLKLLVKCTPAKRKAILKAADDALVRTICECF